MNRTAEYDTWVEALKRDFPYFKIYGDPKEQYQKILNGVGTNYYISQTQFSNGDMTLHTEHINHSAELYWKVTILGNQPPAGELFTLVLFKPKNVTNLTKKELPALAYRNKEDAFATFCEEFGQCLDTDLESRWYTFEPKGIKSKFLASFINTYYQGNPKNRINDNNVKIDIYIDDFKIGDNPTNPLEYRVRGYYKSSKDIIENLKDNDIFSWLCLQSYMTTPVINAILFPLNGDWTKFDEEFSNVIQTHLRVKKYSDPADPYNIFNTFFKAMLIESAKVGKFFHDRTGKFEIMTEDEMIQYYPEMEPFLTMDNAYFTLTYVSAIQNAILSVPKLINPVYSFRGYSPLGIPGTLTLDIDEFKIGEEITTWGFMSVSLISKVSASFLKKELRCCMLKVVIPESMYAFMIQSDVNDKQFPRNLAPFEGEQEILLPAGTIVRFVKNKGLKKFLTMSNETIEVKTAVVEVVGFETPILPEINPIDVPSLRLRTHYY